MMIISREIIKPSSPTPSHLYTYNLSVIDQLSPHTYIPLILFYPNNPNRNLNTDEISQELKKSLSRSLTQYYPFAGRLHTLTSPYIECNDEGVVFVEAKNHLPLDKFENISDKDETLAQLFADGMVWQNSPPSRSLLGVQLNHFACGGIGVAVSLSHKVGDGCTLGSFVSYWASVAHYGSTDHQGLLPVNPRFIQSPSINPLPPAETSVLNQRCVNQVGKRFVFPNSKLSELKNRILAESGLPINEPTRVEVLTSLLYKTAVAAATSKSDSFKPSYLFIPVDMRKKFVPTLPQTTVGNFLAFMMVSSRHSSETSLSVVVSEIQKAKKEVETVESVQQAFQNLQSFLSGLANEDREDLATRSFWCSSLCGFPFSMYDFGWGKPTGATPILGSVDRTGFLLMDTPDGDGIQAQVVLEKHDMEIFEHDKLLLSFCQN